MITGESGEREIRDLQRLLIAVGLLDPEAGFVGGEWGEATQDAVLRAYQQLGWDHPLTGRWISSAALACVAAALHVHSVQAGEAGSASTSTGVGGAGSHAGGAGSHAGGAGSHAGGAGSHAGGAGSHAGGAGSHAGGGSDVE